MTIKNTWLEDSRFSLINYSLNLIANDMPCKRPRGQGLGRLIRDQRWYRSYVALSRVKTLDGLLLKPAFNFERLEKINKSTAMAEWCKELQRLRNLAQWLNIVSRKNIRTPNFVSFFALMWSFKRGRKNVKCISYPFETSHQSKKRNKIRCPNVFAAHGTNR